MLKNMMRQLNRPKVWCYITFITFLLGRIFLNKPALISLTFPEVSLMLWFVCLIWFDVQRGEWRHQMKEKEKERLLEKAKDDKRQNTEEIS
jgi:hypothetical protein